jgi:hypothetical protein
MRKLPAALVALATAVNLVVLAVPASAAARRSFNADPKTVRAGQQVKVFGQGCRSRAFVHIFLTASRSTTTVPIARAGSSTTWRSPARSTRASTG